VVDQTTLVSSPEIKSFTFANIVAQRILATTADLDDIAICQVTSINISVDQNGARTTFTVGEKCPRVSVSPPPVPIYVTDTKNGVGVSWDAGEAFSPSNTGLTTANDLSGKSIAVNNYGRQMVVTMAGLHKRWSGLSTWIDVTNLPDPTNESNDPDPLGITNLEMMKVVDEPLKPYTFHMIASGGHPSGWYRSYVYTTEDYGYNWDTTQMWVPAMSGEVYNPDYQEHAMAPSGKVFDVWTHDMTASLGNAVTVLVSSPVVPFVEQDPDSMYVASDNTGGNSIWLRRDYKSTGMGSVDQGITTSGFIIDARMWSNPLDRDEAVFAVISNDGPTSAWRGAVAVVWETTDGGDNWTEVHNLLFMADDANKFISSYAINIDKESTGSEVRVGFIGFDEDITTSTNTLNAKGRIVKCTPGGSTSYTDFWSGTISVTDPSLGAGETFGGWTHNNIANATNFCPAFEHSAWPGYMVAGCGMYGLKQFQNLILEL
jgi:hypothetical protein